MLMLPKQLAEHELQALLALDHHEPRSVLGFHSEITETGVTWLIRVWEPDAVSCLLRWPEEFGLPDLKLEQEHPAGLFEGTCEGKTASVPYTLHFKYANGQEHSRLDPYYFQLSISSYDQYLFGQGKHRFLHEKLGAHVEQREGIAGVRFAVWAPNARRVSVVGDFNGWDGRRHLLHVLGGSGIWELFVPGAQSGQCYKFELLTQSYQLLLKSDPFAFATEVRPSTASRIQEFSGFTWEDEGWLEKREQTDWLSQPLNIYEVHLGSWKRVPEEENRFLNYRELAEDLIPYVKRMGYTHLELLPIAEHPFDGSWGYQVTGYFAPTSRFGPPEDLMYFINRCHREGLGVIIDWVPGHFPKDAHGLAQFDGTTLYEHEDPRKGEHKEWGTLIFNYGRHEVRNFLISNALFWFEKYHIDGIRVDAVASMLYLDYDRPHGEWIPNSSGGRENLEAIDFFQELHETLFHYFPNVLSIAEESTSWDGVTRPPYHGGLGFNFKWNMGWMNDSLRYMVLNPVHRPYHHHRLSFSLVYAFSENFVQAISHDEVVHGKGSLLNKMPGDEWQKRAHLRLYLCYQFGHPGKKLLFMGSEFGQWREWSEAQSLDWHLLVNPVHQQLQNFSRRLNWFYREHSALYSNDRDWQGFEWIDLSDTQHSIFSFLRRSAKGIESPLIFVYNFTPVPRTYYRVGFPEVGTYRKSLDSDAPEYGGSGFNQQETIVAEEAIWQGQGASAHLDLPPLGCLIWQRIH